MAKSKTKLIKNYIQELPEGSIIALCDFNEIAEPKTISKVLTRLTKKGFIKKVFRAVYWKQGENIDEIDINLVAEAIARNNGWEIISTKETALVNIGLKDENESDYTYLTDGSNRTYKIEGKTINFRHNTSVNAQNLSKESKVVIEVLKAYNSQDWNAESINTVKSNFSPKQTKKIVYETRYMRRKFRNMIQAGTKSENKLEKKMES